MLNVSLTLITLLMFLYSVERLSSRRLHHRWLLGPTERAMKTSFFFFFSARSVRRCWNRLSESLSLYLVVRKSSIPCLPRLVGLSLLAILNARALRTENWGLLWAYHLRERESARRRKWRQNTHRRKREREKEDPFFPLKEKAARVDLLCLSLSLMDALSLARFNYDGESKQRKRRKRYGSPLLLLPGEREENPVTLL